MRQDLCFKQIIQGACLEPINDNVTQAECCCSDIQGVGWSVACQRCPVESTGEESLGVYRNCGFYIDRTLAWITFKSLNTMILGMLD